MMIGRRHFLGAGIATMFPGALRAATQSLDLAIVGGPVWTGLSNAPRSDAIGISGNRIVAIGDRAVRSAITSKTRIIQLDGGFAMPAFIDNHTHFLKASLALTQPELLSARNREEFAAKIGAAAKANPGAWITGQSWDEQRMGGELPTKEWIDAVTPDTPVVVPRTDLHSFLVNSVVLKLAGIDRNTPDPEGGVIVRDAQGNPTGVLKDEAKALVIRIMPPPTAAQDEASVRAGIKLAHENGFAQVHIPEIDWRAHEALRRTSVAKELGLRFYSMVPLQDWEKMAAIVKAEGKGDEWVRWGGLKGLADGSLGARTALFHEEYADQHGWSGVRIIPLPELHTLVADADRAGLHIAVHAIGDLANDDVLDVFQAVEKKNGKRDRRFRIEHAQHVRPATIPRFAKQGVIASVQPFHAIDDGRWAVKRIGETRLNGTYAFRSLIDSGAHVTFGSDWSVGPLDAIQGIHGAVTRETIDGANPKGWLPDQKITVEQALKAYTIENAYAGFQEREVGRVAPGYLADIVVLDRDITKIDPETIHETKIRKTIVGGVERYSA